MKNFFHEDNDLSVIGLTVEQERLVIRRYVIYSIFITGLYALLTVRNILIKSDPQDTQSFIGTIVLIAIFSSYFLLKNHLFAKNYVAIIFIATAVFSFFSYGGITGFFTIDLINIIIFTFILFNIKSLVRFGISIFLIFGVLLILQLYNFISFRENVVYFNQEIDSTIFVLTRLILTVNMILYLKYRHNVERYNLISRNTEFENLNEKLKSANAELMHHNKEITLQKKLIDEQNGKLKNFQQEILTVNNTLEERIQIRTEELLDVNQKLKKTLRELDKFVYSASHDLSAPLKSILGLVQIAKMEKDKNHLNEHFDYIEKSINKQERVIYDLIRYSRNSKNEVSVKNINLSKLLDEALYELKYYPGFDEVKIIKKLKLDRVLTDESRLQVVLNNLLSNAIKYRDRDKDVCEIIISSSKENGQWLLEIEDNGQGIGIEESKKIFDMFYRANECSDGSGLGLFIVAETVEKMNGTIEVKSQLNQGSNFTLSFHN